MTTTMACVQLKVDGKMVDHRMVPVPDYGDPDILNQAPRLLAINDLLTMLVTSWQAFCRPDIARSVELIWTCGEVEQPQPAEATA